MTIIEKMARAIFPLLNPLSDHPMTNFDSKRAGERGNYMGVWTSSRKDFAVEVARAALQALKEPTPEMIGAGQAVTIGDPDWRAPYTGEVWAAMIDAALNEKG